MVAAADNETKMTIATMNSSMVKFILGTVGAGAIAASAPAAPLQRTDVPASSTWLVHVDCDALRSTTVGAYVLAEMDKPENKAKLAIFQALFSFDLRTQLHGATLCGTGNDPKNGVLMVYADFDAARLTALAQSAKGHQTSAYGSHTIYSWIDDKRKIQDGQQPRVYAAIQGNHVIFGQREETVDRALDAAAGAAASLAGAATFADFGTAGDPHVVEAATLKPNLPGSNPNAAILKMAQSIEFTLGESDSHLNGTLTLVGDNPEVCTQICSIAQGLLALAKLQGNKPDSAKIANAINLRQDGARVIGTLDLPAGDVVEMMKAAAARKAAQPASPGQ